MCCCCDKGAFSEHTSDSTTGALPPQIAYQRSQPAQPTPPVKAGTHTDAILAEIQRAVLEQLSASEATRIARRWFSKNAPTRRDDAVAAVLKVVDDREAAKAMVARLGKQLLHRGLVARRV